MTSRSLIGKVLGSDYRILSLLGEGGMGSVYLAFQESLDRKLAVKIIRAPLSEDLRLRFQREGLLLSRLDHPNIVRLYSFGFLEDESMFLAMEYLEGKSLSKVLSECHKLEWRNALAVAIDCCRALSHIHGEGIIHRDLKPDNIMLCPDASGKEQVKILDLGLAKAHYEAGAPVLDLTNSGVLVGSPHYMSPEQCKGQPADARSDLYALACVLYRCIYQVCPFDSETAIGILHKHVNEEPRFAGISLEQPENTESLVKILSKGLSKDPAERFQSAEEFAWALQDLLDGNNTGILRLASPNKQGQSRRVRVYSISTVVLLLLAVTLAIPYFQFQKNIKKKTEAELLRTEPHSRNKDYLRSASELIGSAERLLAAEPGKASSAARKALLSLSRLRSATDDERTQAASLLEKLGKLYLQFGQASSQDSELPQTLRSIERILSTDDAPYSVSRVWLALARIGSSNQMDYRSARRYMDVINQLSNAETAKQALEVYEEFLSKRVSYISPDILTMMKFSILKCSLLLDKTAQINKLKSECDSFLAGLPASRRKAELLNQYGHCLEAKFPDYSLKLYQQAAKMVLQASLAEQIDGPNPFELRSGDTDHHRQAISLVLDYAQSLLAKGEIDAAGREYETLKEYLKSWETRTKLLSQSTDKKLSARIGLDAILVSKDSSLERFKKFEREYKSAFAKNRSGKRKEDRRDKVK